MGVAEAVRREAEPVAVGAPAENCVVLGAGVAITDTVVPSSPLFPVSLMTYREPTTGAADAVLKVNVTTFAEMEYAVTTNGGAVACVDAAKVGGAPGPVCDKGR